MKLFQVVLHRIKIAVVEAASEDELEALVPENLWSQIDSQVSLGTGTLLQEVTETTDIADATSVCPHCLSPIKLDMEVSVSGVIGEELDYTEPKNVHAVCIKDPSHSIPPRQVALLVSQLTSQSTSEEAPTPS